MAAKAGVRRSIQEIYAKYQSGEDRETLQQVIRAFKGIQEKGPNDPDSFFVLGGWHGEPFRGPGKKANAQFLWWGGYCNHGNVLFPTWHRAYIHRLEKALQSVEGCDQVMLPFWDECFEMDQVKPDVYDPEKPPVVVPEIFTSPKFKFDNEDEPIDNPLYSYKLARDISFARNTPWDPSAESRNTRYSKPKGYQTVRFPLSGLVGTAQDQATTTDWNKKYDNATCTKYLNANVANWLEGQIKLDKNPGFGPDPPRLPDTFSVYAKFKLCLDAPNYTVFSNVTSANQWIKDSDTPNERESIVPLEAPHNAMHLAVGGFYQSGVYNANVPDHQNAQGDMGDNETASFDPIFFFHHCFIDYVFWCWQRRSNLVHKGDLSIIYDYEGTITDDQGSPVGIGPGSVLDMNTPLMPFRHPTEDRYFTSHDMTDIAALGYEYGAGSLDPYVAPKHALLGLEEPDSTSHEIAQWNAVKGINRAAIEGSFVIRTYAVSPDGQTEIEIGREAVLSRLNVRGCQNCQTHLEAESLIPVYQAVVDGLKKGSAEGPGEVSYRVEVQTHKGVSEKVPAGFDQGEQPPYVEPF